MTRIVHCRKYQEPLPGLDQPPYPGATGKDIYDNISKKAWQAWMTHQTMLINEKQLSLMDTGTRVYLSEQMALFFAGDDFEKAEGYVPPTPE